jgi:hypothetical protein
MESGHAGNTSTAARREDVADGDILDELRVDTRLLVRGA